MKAVRALRKQLKLLHFAEFSTKGDRKNKGYIVFCIKSDDGEKEWRQYAVKRKNITNAMLSNLLSCLNNVYVAVNTMRSHERSMRGVFTYNALFLDIDLKGWTEEEREGYYSLPHVKERLEKLKPSLIIRTPFGYHEYYLIEACWGQADPMKLMWQDAQDALIESCKEADPQANDSARVLRASGFHSTLKNKPFDVYTYYEAANPERKTVIEYLDILTPNWREVVEEKKNRLREEGKKGEKRIRKQYETAKMHKEAGTYLSKKNINKNELYGRAHEKGIHVKGSVESLHRGRLIYYASLIDKGFVSYKADGSGRRKRIIFLVALSLAQLKGYTNRDIWDGVCEFNKKFNKRLTKAELEMATYSVLVKGKRYKYKSITILKDLGLLLNRAAYIGLYFPDTPEAAKFKREMHNAKRREDYAKEKEEERQEREEERRRKTTRRTKTKNQRKKRRSDGQISKRQRAYELHIQGYSYEQIRDKVRMDKNKKPSKSTVHKWIRTHTSSI